jgi:hypothetical protein
MGTPNCAGEQLDRKAYTVALLTNARDLPNVFDDRSPSVHVRGQ